MTINEDILRELQTGTTDDRKYICDKEFLYFALYYFPEFFTYDLAPFHYEMYEDLQQFLAHKFKHMLWLMFRESAKTSIVKIFVLYCIVYKKKRFINYDAYDKSNAEAALFDIATWLQTNEAIIADFGQLFYEDPRQYGKHAKMKRISEFVTKNGVKIKAYSTQESTRGRVFKNYRPDMFVMDDFETSKTKESWPITAKIISHIDEMKAGLGPDGQVIFLGNYITENGSVARLIQDAERNPASWRYRRVDLIDRKGTIAWPDKYTITTAEAIKINTTIDDPKQWKISVEQKRKDLGDMVFETEMQNNPAASGEMVFDRIKIDEAIKRARPFLRETAGFKIWEDYNPKHRYAIGADTSEGVGRDSNASVLIDFTRRPNLVAGTYENNKIAPDIFSYELKRQGEMFGECLIAPEINNTGFATITQLKQIYPIVKIYRRMKKENVENPQAPELGWKTTAATKPDIIYQFKSAFEDGELEILDEGLLNEMRAYTQTDLKELTMQEGMTRHFDKLVAACIAWEMRNYALTPDAARPKFRQAPYMPQSSYEGAGR